MARGLMALEVAGPAVGFALTALDVASGLDTVLSVSGGPADRITEAASPRRQKPYRLAVTSWLAGLWRTHRGAVIVACALAAAAIAGAFIWPITDLVAAHDVGTVARARGCPGLRRT